MSSRVLPQFDLLAPGSIPEALDMLATHQGEVSVLAGGTDLLIWNYIRNKRPAYLLSLKALDELDSLEYVPGKELRIGAKTKVARLLSEPVVREKFAALYEAASTFATPQIRNMATVVGNVLRGSPAGDCSCAILALGGQVVLKGHEGERIVDIDDFWLSYGVTACRSDELAVEVRIPEMPRGSRCGFQRMTRVHEDLSKLNVAIRLDMAQGIIRQARIAMGCVGPTLLRLKGAEGLLKEALISEELIEKVAAAVQTEISPIDDQRSTAEYRREVSGVIVRRLLQKLIEGH